MVPRKRHFWGSSAVTIKCLPYIRITNAGKVSGITLTSLQKPSGVKLSPKLWNHEARRLSRGSFRPTERFAARTCRAI
jgi:hypothetical protein